MNYESISIHNSLICEIEYLKIQIIKEIIEILYKKPYIDYIVDDCESDHTFDPGNRRGI